MQKIQPIEFYKTPERLAGQKNVLELRCQPLHKVRVAFVGLGMRMNHTLKRFIHIPDAEIRVICDISHEKIENAQKLLRSYNYPAVSSYLGADDWKKVCERHDIDLVYISTHYDLHVPIAVYAMQCGKHAAIEVPAATTIEDCWILVDTAEQTQRHCMQLENCNYGLFELATLNMAQNGVLGEIVHAEGAYIHDLKKLIFDTENGYWNMWRLKYHEKKNGNLYPTHGFGPVCHAMDIHRGDSLHYLVSMSSNQFNLHHYARENFGTSSEFAQKEYRNGDMNVTMVRTRKGKTIMLQHDITSPRPYSRIHMLSGTKGFVQKWPRKGIAIAPNGLEYLSDERMEQLLLQYEHPIRKQLKELVAQLEKKVCSIAKNENMDYIMDYRLVYCLKHGLPLDQDVYDAVEWSCIMELSEKSVENFSMPVLIPDFLRGDSNVLKMVNYYF
jgi:predicted dehydrogenase